MTDNNSFKKIQITISLNKLFVKIEKISKVSIEIGYPNSKGEYIWKSSARVYNSISKSFLKSIGKSGNEIYAIIPSSWDDFENSPREFVFDFVKNSNSSKIMIKQVLYIEENNLTTTNDFEVSETDSFVSFPCIEVRTKEKIIGDE